MSKVLTILVVIALLAGGVYFWNRYKGVYYANKPAAENIVSLIEKAANVTPKPGENKTSLPLTIPDGYSLSLYAEGLGNPRDMELDSTGIVLVSLTSQGKVVALAGSEKITVADGLNRPHGLAFAGSKLYVAETSGVVTFDYDASTRKASNKKKIVDLPSGGGHFTRSIAIKGGKLYVSTGSSCNVCIESDKRRAAIWQSNLDGGDFRPFATGLRNSVFMTFHPGTGEMWATEMGRDNLGDDNPPDEVNIVREGQFYGWPYCWGDGSKDKDTNGGGSKYDCSKSTNPAFKLQAHSAPLGLAFLDKDLLIAYHGSWNRSVPTGYKVVRVRNGNIEDFVSGWLRPDGSVLGRPADVLVKGREIYISDDKAGAVYLLKPI